MYNFSRNIFRYKFYIIYLLFFIPLLELNASNKIKFNNYTQSYPNSLTKIIQNKSFSTPYLLDTGDLISINFIGLETFSGNYVVDGEGYIFLPELNKYNVRKHSIDTIQKDLSKKFSEVINDPKLIINLIRPRPVSFFLGGEVKRPGIYTIKYEISNDNKGNSRPINISPSPVFLNEITAIEKKPTLYDALKNGNGFSSKANSCLISNFLQYSFMSFN